MAVTKPTIKPSIEYRPGLPTGVLIAIAIGAIVASAAFALGATDKGLFGIRARDFLRQFDAH